MKEKNICVLDDFFEINVATEKEADSGTNVLAFGDLKSGGEL